MDLDRLTTKEAAFICVAYLIQVFDLDDCFLGRINFSPFLLRIGSEYAANCAEDICGGVSDAEVLDRLNRLLSYLQQIEI